MAREGKRQRWLGMHYSRILIGIPQFFSPHTLFLLFASGREISLTFSPRSADFVRVARSVIIDAGAGNHRARTSCDLGALIFERI